MIQKKCKKMIALILAAVMIFTGLELPSFSVYAEEITPPAGTSGVISDDGEILTYGNRSDLDGADIGEPLEITNENEMGFFNSMGVINMTMLVRFDDHAANQRYALFTMANESKYFTFWYNPGANRIGFSMNHTNGLFTDSAWRLSGPGYHKISFMLQDSQNISVQIDNQTCVNKSWAQFQGIMDLITDTDTATSVWIGKGSEKITAADYQTVELAGDIRYLKFSKSTTRTDNSEVDANLSANFTNYVSECAALEQADYMPTTWTPFAAALASAQSVQTTPTEWGIHNTYAALREAREGLIERNGNKTPVGIAGVSRTLVTGKTLKVYGKELATDEDGDAITIKDVTLPSESALSAAVENGILKIEQREEQSASAAASENISCTVTDGTADVAVEFTVDIEEAPLKLEYDLEGMEFNPAANTDIFTAGLKDARKLSQLKDSLNITMTYRLDSSKAYHSPSATNRTIYYLMEVADSANNYSENDTNAGGSQDPAQSTIYMTLQDVQEGRVSLNTGKYQGGATVYFDIGRHNNTDYHTLTVSIQSDAIKVYHNGQEVAVNINSGRGFPDFFKVFLGLQESNATYQNWSPSIDTLTIGGSDPHSSGRHPNYGNFPGEIKSVVIADGESIDGENGLETFHKSSGTQKPLQKLRTLFDSVSEAGSDASGWAAYIATEAYQTSSALLNGSSKTYAADIYNNVIPALQAAINDLSNSGLTDLGEAIRDDGAGMFNGGDDNTWLFGGGVETQGRFEEIAGRRSYVYQFEEYIRWLKAKDSAHKRQRYMVSTGKKGTDAALFAANLDGYITALDPKAVAYLIGPEDYEKGRDGVETFKTALTSIIEKSIAVRENTGFAVIQLPHSLQQNHAQTSNVELYNEAAKEAIRTYVLANQTVKDRIVLVDHYNLTNTDNFKNNCLGENGLLNEKGHYELAKEFASETFGSTDGFQAVKNWTLEGAEDTFLNLQPTVTAGDGGILNVTIPSGTPEGITDWTYLLEIDDKEICGVGHGNSFQIDELKEDAAYSLCIKSSDGTVWLKKVYGTTTNGETGGPAVLSQIQRKIREKADDKTKPLTWMFMGDSITHGAEWTYDHDSITQLFEKYLKEDLERTDDIVINTAVSSATTGETLDNIARRLETYHPDIVSVMLGTNDSNSSSISVEQYKQNMKVILEKIRAVNPEALIIIRTPTPTSSTNHKNNLEAGYLAACKQVADEDGNVLYIDQYTQWDIELDTFPYLYGASYHYGNNLHPGVAGHLILAKQFISECGLNTDTKIPNLSYQLPYTDETSESITPEPEVGQTKIAINKAELERLASEYGQSIGAFEVKLTDQTTQKIYTQHAYASDGRFVMDNLPNEGNHTYTLQVTGTLTGSAKYVRFKETEVTLREDAQALNFAVIIDNTEIRDNSEGSTVGELSAGLAAPSGVYQYEFVDIEDEENDNNSFVIENNLLKIKTDLEIGRQYNVCVQAVLTENNAVRSRKETLRLSVIPTLKSVRQEAQNSFLTDKMALDIDLSDVSFGNGSYVDFADTEGDWYDGGSYLQVLNNLRTKSTGGTIIYRFRTSQQKAMIFGSGSSQEYNKNTMCFGLTDGAFRGSFRNAAGTGLRGTIGPNNLGNGQWHTLAISFDTTKIQNQVLLCVDGNSNVYNTGWWSEAHKTWFNMNPDDAITHFEIGGGICTTFNMGADPLSEFTGNLSFLTVTDTPYSEEELKVITETPLISGRQNLSIVGNRVVVPKGAHYTSSDLVWSEENAVAEFTLTAEDGMLFDVSGSNAATVTVTSDTMDFENTNVLAAANGKTLRVTVSTQPWRADTVLETKELTYVNGASSDDGAQISTEVLEKLASMRRGSVTIRYKLGGEIKDSDSKITLFYVSGSEQDSNASFYIKPSNGMIGYEVRNQQTVVNADSAALADIKNTDWHTITYTFEPDKTKIYLDSVLVLENRNGGFLKSVKDVQSAQIALAPFSGEINELCVTYDVLDAAEVEGIHAATTGDKLELPESAKKTPDMNLFAPESMDLSDYRLPGLLTTSEGTVIAAADKRQTTNAGMGNIDTIIKTSADNGKTWSTSKTVFNQPKGAVMDSFTMSPSLVEGENGRIHMIVNLFPESQGAWSAGLIENGSGFKVVNGKAYPVLRNYPNSALNVADKYTQEYTIRENGVVWEENSDGSSTQTQYRVPEYLSADGGGDLYRIGETESQTPCGNIFVYTGENAGELKVPRVMSLVSCYSDDEGATWEGYQNITHMVKEEWVKYMNVTPGAGIRLQHQTDNSLNGRLMIPVYHANDKGINSYSSTVIYSDDNGESWKIAQCALSQLETQLNEETDIFRDKALREAQVVEMNDGSIQLFCSNYSGTVKICTGTPIAADDGVNWTSIHDTPVPDVGNQLSVIHAPRDIDGKEAILVSKPAGPETSNGYIRIAYYENGSFDWKYLHKIKFGEFGNSCLSVLNDGSIGLLYKANENIVFTSMSLDYLTAPRYQAFTVPEIELIKMTKQKSNLIFDVTLDSSLMKKGNPILKIKLNDTTEAQAVYQSGNASKKYVFTYDVGTQNVTDVEAISVGVAAGDTVSFIEGVTGALPEDTSFKFTISSDLFITQIQELLDEYEEIYHGTGAAYITSTWTRFHDAYEAAAQAIADQVEDMEELEGLLTELSEACEGLAAKPIFHVLLNNKKLNDGSAGSIVGQLSVDQAASEGTYSYALVDNGEEPNDNAKFEIEETTLKVKTDLEPGETYRVCIQAENADNSEICSLKDTFEITVKDVMSLKKVRAEAKKAFAEDGSALDVDLSGVSFGNGTYVDFADENGDWYNEGKYLGVLNYLREHSTGGTIIFRFRTAQSSALIFGAGTNELVDSKPDNNSMCFGINTAEGKTRKDFRGIFRTSRAGLTANYTTPSEWTSEQWHTAAISFDTTKADYQNQILISIDGSDNIFSSAHWQDGWQSWFNVNPQNVINHFAIGGGIYASQNNLDGSRMPAFEGKISFITVTGESYTEEELKLISQTPSDVDVIELIQELESKLDEYKALLESGGSDYTTETWEAFQGAYEDAQAALEAGNKDVNQLTSLLAELKEAREGLTEKNPGPVVDPEVEALREELEGKLREYKPIYDGDGSEYDTTNWQAFRQAYKAVKDALDGGETDKAALEQLRTELYQAYENLTDDETPVDPELEALISLLEGKLNTYKPIYEGDGGGYDTAKWEAFRQAYKAVKDALDDGEDDKETLGQLLEALNQAYSDLTGEEPVDPEVEILITVLEGKLNEYKPIYEGDGSEYDAAKWEAFRQAYKAVKDALDEGEMDKSVLEQLRDALNQAYSDLKKHTPADPEVEDAIAQIEEKLEEYKEVYEGSAEGYKAAAWIRFENAYYAAMEAVKEDETDLEVLKGLLKELKDAYKALNDKDPVTPVDPEVEALQEDMQKKLDEYKELFQGTGEKYTTDTWNRFQAAYQAVKDALEKNEQKKNTLNELLKELNESKAALKEKPASTVDEKLEAAKKALNGVLTLYKNIYTKDKANYTDVSWKKFSDAYQKAQNALKSMTDAAQLTTLQKQLESAYRGLVKKQAAKTPLKAPAISSVSFVAEKSRLGVKVTVQKVANAASYTVYRVIGGAVIEIGKTDAAGVAYDENPISKKQMSYYAVANPSSSKYTASAKGSPKSITLAASVKKVKVKSAKKKAVLSWKKVKNAKQYVIYRSTQKDSGYVKVKALKKNKLSYTDKKVKKGKTYYYRIVVKTKQGYTGFTTSKKLKIKK